MLFLKMSGNSLVKLVRIELALGKNGTKNKILRFLLPR